MKSKNKLTIVDTILSVVCIVISMEAITPTAASGNSQFFYWLVILVLFFIPYSLVNAELGSTFPSEYGIYHWTKKALGEKMGLRVAWYYWINYPIWMLSFAILFSDLAEMLFNIELGVILSIIIQFIFMIVTCYFGTKRVNKLDDMIDVGAIFKLIILTSLIILGFVVFINHGSATSFALETFKPTFEYSSLTIIALLLFNFTGVEIVTTHSNDMKDKKNTIVKTILYSCFIIIVFYLLPIISMKIALPSEEINSSTGLINSFAVLLSSLGFSTAFSTIITSFVTVMFMYILIAIIISWAFGVNSVVRKAAEDIKAPSTFTSINEDNVPDKLSWLNALIGCVLCLFVNLSPGLGNNLFMIVFGTSVIVYLCSYLPLFYTFYKLRKYDNTKRTYKIPGNKLFILFITIIPTVVLAFGIFCLLIPELNLSMFEYQWPVIVTFIIIVIIGEIIIYGKKLKK